MAKLKVVILDSRYEHYNYEREALSVVGAEVVEGTAVKTDDDAVRLCRDADGIIVNLQPLPAGVVDKLEKCRVISRYGVGYDNVDIPACTRKKIAVVNVPDYCHEDVSDHAMALILACVRKTARRDRELRQGLWGVGRKDPMYRTQGKTVGLAGFGRIPRTLHRKLKGFDFKRILVHDPFVKPDLVKGLGAEAVDFDTLLKDSDILSIHVPLSEKTKHMFGEKEFKKMKRTAIVVNTSRGGLIDTKAVVQALKSGALAAAGLDVHEVEPLPKDSPLFGLDNVVLSDHTGWYSEESQAELQTKAAKGVAAVLAGKWNTVSVVNKEIFNP